MKTLRYSELVDVPWKNGGGITRNIALANLGEQTAWRLSRADVATDGAFSSFAGLERILTMVSYTGMVLHHQGGALDADPWQPVRFGGELKEFSGLIDGPLTDLNLMFDPSLCDGAGHHPAWAAKPRDDPARGRNNRPTCFGRTADAHRAIPWCRGHGIRGCSHALAIVQ